MLLIIILSIMHVLTVNIETDINSSYAIPIRPRFIRNAEIYANGHGREARRQNNFGLTRNEAYSSFLELSINNIH